ncbi:hypothetical protein [Thiothrix caldifontis]|nr:hypothetical protein [Thiothrix caldifontis]
MRTQNDVGGAVKIAWNGVYPEDPKFTRRLENVSILARALHQAGETQKAYAHFMDAEHLQQSHDPEHPRLHSLSNFRLCELLLEQGKLAEVAERTQYALAIAQKNAHPLYIGLSQLLIGRVYLQQGNAHEAKAWLDSALNALQEAGNQDHLPRGYLARAVFYRTIGDFRCARADLQAMWEIVELNGMRLHLTDYHLEMARLLVAEEENPPQSPFCKGGSQEDTGSAVPPFEKGGLGGISLQAHIEAAAKLINETGYHRRDIELSGLQQHLR